MTIRLNYVLLCMLVSGCAHPVKIFYPPESLKYLATYNRVLLADSIRQRGLRSDYKIAGKGTPLVVYAKTRKLCRRKNTIRRASIAFGITAVERNVEGKCPCSDCMIRAIPSSHELLPGRIRLRPITRQPWRYSIRTLEKSPEAPLHHSLGPTKCVSVSCVRKRYGRGLICIPTAESRVVDCAERD
jgi:hypothetical protein